MESGLIWTEVERGDDARPRLHQKFYFRSRRAAVLGLSPSREMTRAGDDAFCHAVSTKWGNERPFFPRRTKVPLQEVFNNLIKQRLLGSEKPSEIPDGRKTALGPMPVQEYQRRRNEEGFTRFFID
jgi:hypothetical protein